LLKEKLFIDIFSIFLNFGLDAQLTL
jgi:hypothetical protein